MDRLTPLRTTGPFDYRALDPEHGPMPPIGWQPKGGFLRDLRRGWKTTDYENWLRMRRFLRKYPDFFAVDE